ncbi:hypothetical protein S40288_01072 [Stachybotrys chartarum IBT 40288]|nr:hypothetical protein S40288_01072 [Stachybotrys chartarum IBT 40288]
MSCGHQVASRQVHLLPFSLYLVSLTLSFLSSGEPDAQPPTPQRTPISNVLPSPVLGTPRATQAFFSNQATWPPHYTEDYSVFNSGPASLSATEGRGDFSPITPLEANFVRRKPQSAEGLAIEIATHPNYLTTSPGLPLPPVDPARRLASSPSSLIAPREYSAKASSSENELLLHIPTRKTNHVPSPRSLGTTGQNPKHPTEQSQTITPPPSSHKRQRRSRRKLAPQSIMQDDQDGIHPDFTGSLQQDMASFVGTMEDMKTFGFPFSAPVTAPPNPWDSSYAFDFDLSLDNVVNNPAFLGGAVAPPQGAPMFPNWTGSFHSIPNTPVQPSLSRTNRGSQEAHNQVPSSQPGLSQEANLSPNTFATSIATSFAFPESQLSPHEAVNPGLLFHQPQPSALGTTVDQLGSSSAAELASMESRMASMMEANSRPSTAREPKNSTVPNRASASSPIRSSARPGLGRSLSENRGRKASTRNPLPTLAPAPSRQGSGGNASDADGARPIVRQSGRASPLKSQHRLSALASIPESSPQPKARTSIRFTIDERGRARVESTNRGAGGALDRDHDGNRSSQDLARRDSWDLSESESTDDEPIVIPSRSTSFNASFALPDPRKPVGSIFHTSRRSISDRSTSTVEGHGARHNDADSEAETVANDRPNNADAYSEVQKLVKDRQKRPAHPSNTQPQHFSFRSSRDGMHGVSISSNSGLAIDDHPIRCVCQRNGADEEDGFMIQCESCEMWLHGRCINITKRLMPRVYICAFCANTPNMRGGRMRDTRRHSAIGLTLASPLANKSMRSFR